MSLTSCRQQNPTSVHRPLHLPMAPQPDPRGSLTVASLRRRAPAPHQPPLGHPGSVTGGSSTMSRSPASGQPRRLSTAAGWARRGASPPFSLRPPPRYSPLGRRGGRGAAQPWPPIPGPARRGAARSAIVSRTAALRAPGGREGGAGGAGRRGRNKAGRGSRRGAAGGAAGRGGGGAGHAAPRLALGGLRGRGQGGPSAAPRLAPGLILIFNHQRLSFKSQIFIFVLSFPSGARCGWVRPWGRAARCSPVSPPHPPHPPALRPLGGAWTRSTGTPPPPLGWPCQRSSWACGEDRWPSPAGAPRVAPQSPAQPQSPARHTRLRPGASAGRGQGAWAGRLMQAGLTRPLTATRPLAFVLFSQHTFGDIAERGESPGCCFPSALETSG